MSRTISAAVAFVVTTSAFACVRSPTPCQAPADCGDGQECLASRCTPVGGVVVSEESERYVMFPRRILAQGVATADAALQLGGPGGARRVHIEFQLRPEVSAHAETVEAAFLALSSPNLTPSTHAHTPLSVGLLLDAPDPDGIAPRASLTKARALLRPASRTRVDVTNMVRAWARAPEQRHGFVLEADGARPILLSTGAAGNGPELELYVRRGTER